MPWAASKPVWKLIKMGFKENAHDNSVFYQGECIYVLYTDNTLLFGADKTEVQRVTRDLLRKNLKLTV